jgi:hypothetical protein
VWEGRPSDPSDRILDVIDVEGVAGREDDRLDLDDAVALSR